MRALFGSIVLTTLLASCLGGCWFGYNGRKDFYLCEELTNLNLQIPLRVAGINIIKSNLSKITADAFMQYAETLIELNITGCGLELIEPDAFKGLNKLQLLNLSNNKIHKIEALSFTGMPNLRSLYLYRNRISEIDPEFYDLMPNLEILDVAHNDMTVCMYPKYLMKLKSLREIYIGENPWSYRCRTMMTSYLQSQRIRYIRTWAVFSDSLIDDCLAHEPEVDKDEAMLKKCVERKTNAALPYDLLTFTEKFRELSNKLTQLEADVTLLKKSAP